jgi:lipopolysaccharide/colanic/teichoic acid biosynthesis glycosyltransferase
VRLTSPGPALFRQERVGRDGRSFTILKFRSMPVSHDATEWNAAYTAEPTRLGRVMRATSLDELPQLINVIRGEMSLVGPRPEIPVFVDQFTSSIRDYRWRHRLPAGMTGWAQVHGLRGDTSIEDRVRLDNAYIDRWSLKRELSILSMTILQMIPRRRSSRTGLHDGAEVIDLRDEALRPPERSTLQLGSWGTGSAT